ncbi:MULTISPECIES: Sec-independent protein translocase protein TatB [Methylophaga]|uniref:Sec-independent protein translocase protein TatB n=1 Tax=Methylophaga muralis TaxID=291169 RepID=A0A1E3GWJ2_9GAMM|nr:MULTISPECIES: Sec-independent protein translocase protein TatB [Methylophaga]ODN68315.1 Sec-independent protein translocase protein TatB [Methylophaga muralis]THK41586.1 twin-arginine translocase subunit TatB [Methylophaga sp. SB9B]
MFDIGFWELLLIAVVALVVVGPERLPKLVRVCGLWLGRANASLQAVKNDIAKELRAEEIKQAFQKPDDLPDLNEIIDLDEPIKSKPNSDKPLGESSDKKQADDGK